MKRFISSLALAAMFSGQGLIALAMDPLPQMTVPGTSGIVANYKTSTAVPAMNSSTFARIAEDKVSLIRYLPDWQLIEKTKGQYDFSYPDWLFSQIMGRGMRPMIGLGLNNPLYGVKTRVRTKAQRIAFGNYVQALVKRYRGKQVIWEIWNEPNLPGFWKRDPGEELSTSEAVDEYLAMVDVLVPIIQQEDPSAIIIGPALAGYNTPWLQLALKRGLLSKVDGLSVHPYQRALLPEKVIREHAQVQTWIPLTARNKPIFFTEWGYSTGIGTYEVPEETAARLIERQYLTSLMLGIRGNTTYSLTDNGTSEKCTTADKCYGMFTKFNGTPRPAYLALMSMVKKLNGFTYTKRVPAPLASTYIMEFKNNQGTTRYAVWDTDTTSFVPVELPDHQKIAATQRVKVIDGCPTQNCSAARIL